MANNLTIAIHSYKRVDVLEASGRVDSSNSAELETALQGLMDNGRYQLVLDLSKIDYMSSAGLRAIVSALRTCKKSSGDVRLSNPSERVKEVLRLAGLESMFQAFDDQTAAVGSF